MQQLPQGLVDVTLEFGRVDFGGGSDATPVAPLLYALAQRHAATLQHFRFRIALGPASAAAVRATAYLLRACTVLRTAQVALPPASCACGQHRRAMRMLEAAMRTYALT